MDSIIKDRMKLFVSKYPAFADIPDYKVFTISCIKDYYFDQSGEPFDPELALEWITDGPNDGGIDAIINDPNSDENDVIIVQSKYYESSNLTFDEIVAEISKINITLKNLKDNKTAGLNDNVVTQYKIATDQLSEGGTIRINFFTSYKENSNEKRKVKQKAKKALSNYIYDLYFGEDIEAQINLCESSRLTIESGELKIDSPRNMLKYEESVIVNVSAASLRDLHQKKRNALLGLNLRYYVPKKDVDEAIDGSINVNPNEFWYKNNGIVIACEDYQIDGRSLKLKGFSIINGGQTTNRIGHSDFEEDFFLPCKVVKAKGAEDSIRYEFIDSIANASNRQKPIKRSDMLANSKEQKLLKKRLEDVGVYYIIKHGDKVPKKYAESYEYATLEKVGKAGLASILQMPCTARGNAPKMFSDDAYYKIFGTSVPAGIIADALKISYYYNEFMKESKAGSSYDPDTLGMISNGATVQLACITFLCKINNGVFEYSDVSNLMFNLDELKRVIQSTEGMARIINNNVPDEKDIFFKIFKIISLYVLRPCFMNARNTAIANHRTLDPSDYLKNDSNYYRDIIPSLWMNYGLGIGLDNYVKSVCLSQ